MLEDIWQSDQWQRARVGIRFEGNQEDNHRIPLEVDTEEASITSQFLGETIQTRARSHKYKRATVSDSSKGLEKFIPGNSVDLLNTLSPSPFASIPVATKLREWLASATSTLLWVRGMSTGCYPSDLSALSGSIINAASESKTPIMFHFCEPIRSTDMAEGLTAEESGVLALVYSLIRQLILLLESAVDNSFDLRAERFQKLESPLQNWEEAISILGDLLVLSPGVLFCVIDGVDDLDYGRRRTLFGDVLGLMRRHQVSSKQNGLT